ncbi:MAG: putative zinc-binding metallopeptidase [Planctomycetota bacterium]
MRLDAPLSSFPRNPRRTRLAPLLAQLDDELGVHGLPAPPVWFSIDWFAPNSIWGFAIPFYLASDDLIERERQSFGPLEDSEPEACLRFLRHETGHAIDTAFRLARRRELRAVFGPRSTPYRSSYEVDPWRDDFVVNLPRWYAQSHPAEDFAETFAVWLADAGVGRTRAAGEKLAAVAACMEELADEDRIVRTRERTGAIDEYRGSVELLFEARVRTFELEERPPFLPTLERLFRRTGGTPDRSPAARALRGWRPGVAARVIEESGISRASFRMLWPIFERTARLARLGHPRVEDRAAIEALTRAALRSLHALRRGSWLLSR